MENCTLHCLSIIHCQSEHSCTLGAVLFNIIHSGFGWQKRDILTKYAADYFAIGCKNFGGHDENSKGTWPIREILKQKERL